MVDRTHVRSIRWSEPHQVPDCNSKHFRTVGLAALPHFAFVNSGWDRAGVFVQFLKRLHAHQGVSIVNENGGPRGLLPMLPQGMRDLGYGCHGFRVLPIDGARWTRAAMPARR